MGGLNLDVVSAVRVALRTIGIRGLPPATGRVREIVPVERLAGGRHQVGEKGGLAGGKRKNQKDQEQKGTEFHGKYRSNNLCASMPDGPLGSNAWALTRYAWAAVR